MTHGFISGNIKKIAVMNRPATQGAAYSASWECVTLRVWTGLAPPDFASGPASGMRMGTCTS